MTFFEYLSIAFSLVLAFGVSRGLNGVRSAFMQDRRYWPHAIWLVNKLLNAASYWWWWRYNVAVSYWNVLTFFAGHLVPGHSLSSNRSPGQVRKHGTKA
jgi:hypothetical protein